MLKIFINNGVSQLKKAIINIVSFIPFCILFIPKMIGEYGGMYIIFNIIMMIFIFLYLGAFTLKCPKCLYIIPIDKRMKSNYVRSGFLFNIIFLTISHLIISMAIKMFTSYISIGYMLIQTYTFSIISASVCLIYNRGGVNNRYDKYDKLRNIVKSKKIYNQFYSVSGVSSLVFSIILGLIIYILQLLFLNSFSEIIVYSIVLNLLSTVLMLFYIKKSHKAFLLVNTDYELVFFDRDDKYKDGGIKRC